MMTVQFYNYLAAVEVQPQSVATPTHKFTRARYSGAAPLPGQTVDCPGQILQIRDCPGDSGTVGAYVTVCTAGPISVYVRTVTTVLKSCEATAGTALQPEP